MMVAFVVCWVGYYQFGIGMSDEKEIASAMAKIEDHQKKELEMISDDSLWAMSKDPKIVAAGAASYSATCIACHAPDMSAKIAGVKLPGLPLNDREWKHGNNPTQLLTIVRKGAPDLTKGMPPWEPQLGIHRVVEVLAFILSKHKQGEPFTLSADTPLKK
jgi:cytochrome c oxidase cbb3-type subunit 3